MQVFGDPLLVPDGSSASTPGMAFRLDPDTGLFRPGTNRLQVVTNGVARYEVDAAGVQFPVADNTYDLGKVANRLKDIYFAGTLKFGGMPYVLVTDTTLQSMTNGADLNITWNTDLFNNYVMHSTTTNTERLVAPKTGLYLIFANSEYANNATGARRTTIRLNGAAGTILSRITQQAASGRNTVLNQSIVYPLTATDFIQLQQLQDSGGALNTGTTANFFGMVLLGPSS